MFIALATLTSLLFGLQVSTKNSIFVTMVTTVVCYLVMVKLQKFSEYIFCLQFLLFLVVKYALLNLVRRML